MNGGLVFRRRQEPDKEPDEPPDKQPVSLDEMSELALLRSRNSTFELAKSLAWAFGSGILGVSIAQWGLAGVANEAHEQGPTSSLYVLVCMLRRLSVYYCCRYHYDSL